MCAPTITDQLTVYPEARCPAASERSQKQSSCTESIKMPTQSNRQLALKNRVDEPPGPIFTRTRFAHRGQ
ncbi:hypothetical protein RMSM_00761 [Rhodopirellula maiorica SM1]|uniref:Uncharacterized protein n=1 Tax=Rhodopirellula maiorica SM1 TaxID=1265738 RepID=M5S828_9BACT|nr:hypothetical protein RMSM_00761 [Rhodopirellula maiorica SM1]